MKFAFVAAHRSIWPVAWQCSALGVSRSGFHAWLNRPPSQHALAEEKMAPQVRSSFLASDRTYGARRVWHDVLAAGFRCGLHKIERLMRAQALRARPRRRGLPKDHGERHPGSMPPNILDRQFAATRRNQKWVADFTVSVQRRLRRAYADGSAITRPHHPRREFMDPIDRLIGDAAE